MKSWLRPPNGSEGCQCMFAAKAISAAVEGKNAHRITSSMTEKGQPMSQAPKCKHGEPERGVYCKQCCHDANGLLAAPALLAADETLGALSAQMHREYEASGGKWPRDWMQKHVNERSAIQTVRLLILNRVGERCAPNDSPR